MNKAQPKIEWILDECGLILSAPPQQIASTLFDEFFLLKTADHSFLLKLSPSTHTHLLQWEMQSAKVLCGFGDPKTPAPIRFGMNGTQGYLLYKDPHVTSKVPSGEQIARSFASLHRTGAPWGFGFNHPAKALVGSTNNRWSKKWAFFFVNQKLGPLVSAKKEVAPEKHSWFEKNYHEIFSCLSKETIKPSLLHGNIDPSLLLLDKEDHVCALAPRCFYGHAQMEIEALIDEKLIKEREKRLYLQLNSKSLWIEEASQIYKFYFELKKLSG